MLPKGQHSSDCGRAVLTLGSHVRKNYLYFTPLQGEIHHCSVVSGEMLCSRDAGSPPIAQRYHPDVFSSHGTSPLCAQGILPTYPVLTLLHTQRLQEG